MSSADAAVAEYLGRLERAAAVLPPDRRQDLLDGIREHIADARAAGAAADEAAVRTLLDRLGAPEEIVAAAREDDGGGGVLTQTRPVGTGLELGAVLMLTAGSFVPVLGWLVGVVLLWTSKLWRVRDKVLGTLVVPLGPGGALVLGGLLPFRGGEACTSTVDATGVATSVECTSSGPPGWLTALLLIALLVAPVVVAVVLLRTARRRAAERPPVVVPPGADQSPWGALEVSGVLVLGLGGLLVPLLGPLVGMALVLSSSRWTGGQKTVAGLLALVPVLLPVSALLIARISL